MRTAPLSLLPTHQSIARCCSLALGSLAPVCLLTFLLLVIIITRSASSVAIISFVCLVRPFVLPVNSLNSSYLYNKSRNDDNNIIMIALEKTADDDDDIDDILIMR
jgi:hypothetical protein